MNEKNFPPFPHSNWIFDPNECVRHALKAGHIIHPQEIVNVNTILVLILEHFGASRDLVMGKRRTKIIVMARHAFRAITKKKTKLTHAMIGALAQDVDHSTISHSIRAHDDIIDMRDRNEDCRDYAERCDKIAIGLVEMVLTKNPLILTLPALAIEDVEHREDVRIWKLKFLQKFHIEHNSSKSRLTRLFLFPFWDFSS